MTKTIFLDSNKIDYDLLKEERKSFKLSVFPSGRVILKAPTGSSEKEISKFLNKKLIWVVEQQHFFKQFKNKKITYVSGSDVLYLGRRYQLILRNPTPDKVEFAGSKIIVSANYAVEEILSSFMMTRAITVFKERLNYCYKFFSYAPFNKPDIKIRKMNKRWGSYLKNGTILLNFDLIQAPKRCIDYVIFHELCHTKYQKHNKQFFDLLSQNCPKYKELKKELELRVLG